jgi:hydrogenase 3 maturation protease
MKVLGKLSGKVKNLRIRPGKKKKKPGDPGAEYPELKNMADIMRFRQSKKDMIDVGELEKLFDEYKKQKTGVQRPFRLAVMGLGNDLKGDDGVGFHIISELEKHLKKTSSVLLLKTGVPENHVKDVRMFVPDLLLIADSAEFRGNPGDIRIIQEKEIQRIFFSSHTTPLTIFTKLLRSELPAVKIIIFGIQKSQTEFGMPMTKPVRESGTRLAITISSLFRKNEILEIEKEVQYSKLPFGLGKLKKFYDRS